MSMTTELSGVTAEVTDLDIALEFARAEWQRRCEECSTRTRERDEAYRRMRMASDHYWAFVAAAKAADVYFSAEAIRIGDVLWKVREALADEWQALRLLVRPAELARKHAYDRYEEASEALLASFA